MHEEYGFTIWMKRSRKKESEYRTYIQQDGKPFLKLDDAKKAWCDVRDELMAGRNDVKEFGLCGFCKRVCGDWKGVER